MSKKSGNSPASRLSLKLKVSPSLAALFSLLHLGALALLFPIDAPLWWSFSLAVLLLLSWYRSLSRHAMRSAAEAVTALRWHDEEGLSVQLGKTSGLHAATLRSRFIHRWLVLLSVQLEGRRLPIALAIAADALEADNFRRLRAALLAPTRTTVA